MEIVVILNTPSESINPSPFIYAIPITSKPSTATKIKQPTPWMLSLCNECYNKCKTYTRNLNVSPGLIPFLHPVIYVFMFIKQKWKKEKNASLVPAGKNFICFFYFILISCIHKYLYIKTNSFFNEVLR